MSQDLIIEGNKKIAQFMGYTYFPHMKGEQKAPGWKTTIDTSIFSKFNQSYNILLKKNENKREYLCRGHNGLKYHISWDWLIEAIIKFRDLDIDNDIYRSHIQEIDSNVIDEYDIHQAHTSLVNAINWYNNK